MLHTKLLKSCKNKPETSHANYLRTEQGMRYYFVCFESLFLKAVIELSGVQSNQVSTDLTLDKLLDLSFSGSTNFHCITVVKRCIIPQHHNRNRNICSYQNNLTQYKSKLILASHFCEVLNSLFILETVVCNVATLDRIILNSVSNIMFLLPFMYTTGHWRYTCNP